MASAQTTTRARWSLALLVAVLVCSAIHNARANPTGNRKESIASVRASSGRARGVFPNPGNSIDPNSAANAEGFAADGAAEAQAGLNKGQQAAAQAGHAAEHIAGAGTPRRALLQERGHASIRRAMYDMGDGVGRDGFVRDLTIRRTLRVFG